MGVGYFQLTITSEHDKYLVGNPQFTFFKKVYRRHTNFAIENQVINFTGETMLGTNSNFGKKFYLRVPRNGDLVHRMYIVFELEGLDKTNSGGETDVKNIENEFGISALSLIDYVQVSIGGQVIDKHTSDWLHIYYELFGKSTYVLCDMINSHLKAKGDTNPQLKIKDGLVYVPLQFWFNRNPGMALPLIALQYTPIQIDLKLNTRDKVGNIGSNPWNTKINKVYLLAEFIHLDSQEKNLFASKNHEYLIEQLQIQDKVSVPFKREMNDFNYEKYVHKFNLPFNHPVKELVWALQDSNSDTNTNGIGYNAMRNNSGNNCFNYWRNLDWKNMADQLIDASIYVNGREIFEPQSATYFRSLQKYQHHSAFGYDDLLYINPGANNEYDVDYSKGSGYYLYSFALHSESQEPSGTLNFSKLDKAELRIRIRRDTHINSHSNAITGNDVTTLKNKMLKVFAINYNVLRIMSGHGGLAFKN